uniref:Uncharacterized protein n=1 Tax=Coccidioides posadasii RMSCC 3488 TaxID=454284 RepID=A0A0J6FRR7_COCPO|nr:hypothetical protein CPAG_08055 [Coccidioides posadasii RMSCC 3488]
MNSLPTPTIKSFDLVADFLEHILHGSASSTTLIVCWTREKFIQKLISSIQLQSRQTEGEEHPTSEEAPILSSTLLSNTIDILDKSRRVTLSFCPSLEHLRAYLGTSNKWPGPRLNPENGPDAEQPLLAILSPIALHFHTSQFSAQGISRTLALAVEAASRKSTRLVLCECQDLNAGEEEHAFSNNPWDMAVPLLNSSTTSRQPVEISAAQTVQIRRIAKKWFHFDQTEREAAGP